LLFLGLNATLSLITKVILVEVFSSLIYVIADIIPQLTDSLGIKFCDVLQYIRLLFYVVPALCSYLALWLRTCALFYRKMVLKQFIKKWVRYVHVMCLIWLIIVYVTFLIIHWPSSNHVMANCSCKIVKTFKSNRMSVVTVFYIFAVLSLHLSFLFSFVYPLYLHKTKMHGMGIDAMCSIIPVMKRAAIVGVVLIVSDLLLVGIAIVFQTPNLRVKHTAVSINLLISAIATVMCFANWKERIFPFTFG